MKYKKIISVILISFFFFVHGIAQTKPKPQAKQNTQTKGTGKKTTPKAISVYVCTNKKDKFFHKYSSCNRLNKCSEEIKHITNGNDLKKYKRKSCVHCFNL